MALSTCLCKSLLGTLNVLVMLIGLALAVVGVILQAASGSTIFAFFEDSIKKILGTVGILGSNDFVGNINFQDLFLTASIVLIVVGLAIACIGFLGCCGASCDYHIILILYSIVLGVLLAAQVIIVILFFSQALDAEIKKQAQKTIDEQFVAIDDSSPASVIWNVIMLRFTCCGLNNYKDFDTAQKWHRYRNLTISSQVYAVNLTTPIACCKSSTPFPTVSLANDWCAVYPNDTISNWDTSCWSEVTTFLSPHRTYAILVITAILVIQAAVLIMTIVILRSDKSKVCPV
jgi:tetraspanin-18